MDPQSPLIFRVRGRGPYLVVKITTKCQRPTSHPYKMTPKKMDSFCREGIGQLYKMEGAKVTDCYKMGRGLERPTHLVVKMNAHENHQQKSRIVKTCQDCFSDALLDACQMAVLPTKPRLNGYTLIGGWLADSAGYFCWLPTG